MIVSVGLTITYFIFRQVIVLPNAEAAIQANNTHVHKTLPTTSATAAGFILAESAGNNLNASFCLSTDLKT